MSPRSGQGVSRRRRAAIVGAMVCLGVVAAAIALVIAASRSEVPQSPAPSPAVTPTPVTSMPAQLAAVSVPCSIAVSSSAAAASSIGRAQPGTVVCLRGGTYAGLDLSGAHAGDVTVQPALGERVTITAGVKDGHGYPVAVLIAPGTTHVAVHGFDVIGTVEVGTGSAFIRVDHNDISGGPFGVLLESEDCRTPNAPRWSGCTPEPKITDVVVSGNRIHNIGGRNGDDAINVNNYLNLRITGNDIYGILEGGNHSDCFQSTFGGAGLVFDHNYEHDNNCQGFFAKDGDVIDALIYDNLFVRDQVEKAAEADMDISDIYDLVVRDNTSWPGNADLLRDLGSAREPQASVEHNVFETLANGCCGDPGFRLTEGHNVFGTAPYSFRPSATDTVEHPRFADPATDDYRLLVDPERAGINWAPARQQFGPGG